MNKYSLREHLAQELGPHLSTFKATSFDDKNGKHLCQDETTPAVYNFDAYVKANCSHPIPASPDAIYIGNKHLYFIEFKNQYAHGIDKEQMQRKFQAGTALLQTLLQEFTAKDCKYHFCVVMKGNSKSKFMDSRHIEKNAIKFGLEELNKKLGSFYDRITTESLDFYIKEHKALKCQKLAS